MVLPEPVPSAIRQQVTGNRKWAMLDPDLHNRICSGRARVLPAADAGTGLGKVAGEPSRRSQKDLGNQGNRKRAFNVCLVLEVGKSCICGGITEAKLSSPTESPLYQLVGGMEKLAGDLVVHHLRLCKSSFSLVKIYVPIIDYNDFTFVQHTLSLSKLHLEQIHITGMLNLKCCNNNHNLLSFYQRCCTRLTQRATPIRQVYKFPTYKQR